MATEIKTKKTTASVERFLDTVEDESRRDDCYAVLEIMRSITKSEPAMWGPGIVGFGSYHYVYASGQEGDWPLTAFSPRKQNLTVYIMTDFFKKYPELLKKLGKCKISKACLYIKSLNDIHLPTLKHVIKTSTSDFKKQLTKQQAAKK